MNSRGSHIDFWRKLVVERFPLTAVRRRLSPSQSEERLGGTTFLFDWDRTDDVFFVVPTDDDTRPSITVTITILYTIIYYTHNFCNLHYNLYYNFCNLCYIFYVTSFSFISYFLFLCFCYNYYLSNVKPHPLSITD